MVSRKCKVVIVFLKNILTLEAQYEEYYAERSTLYPHLTKPILHKEISEIINFDANMYDYKDPSWEGVNLKSLTASHNTTTPLDANNSTVIDEVRKNIPNRKIGYFSTFVSEVCDMCTRRKNESIATKLIKGVYSDVIEFVDKVRTDIGNNSKKALLKYVKNLTLMTEEKLVDIANMTGKMFRDHLHFAADTKKIIKEFETWFTENEGSQLLKTLSLIKAFPNKDHGLPYDGNTKEKLLSVVIAIKVFDAILKPYHRIKESAQANVTHLAGLIEKAVVERWPTKTLEDDSYDEVS